MRYRDWATRLANAIKAASGRPFSWGENDCCVFAAACCMAVCGVDPLAAYRGRYSTEQGAKRVLRAGHGSLAALWDAHFQRIDPALIQRGDVALYESPNGRGVAVWWAGDFWAPGDTGLERTDCVPEAVWRVE